MARVRRFGDPVAGAARVEPLLLGTTVSGGVIAAAAGHTPGVGSLMLAIVGSVLVYWAAHLHAVTLAEEIESGAPLRAVLGRAVVETWRIPGAAVIPLAVLGLATLFGAELPTAAWLAIGVTAALLAGYGYVAGRRAGLGIGGRLASAGGGVAVGLLIILLKASLH